MELDDFDKASHALPGPSETKVKPPSTAAAETDKEVEGQSETVVVEKLDVDEVVSTAAHGSGGVELKEEEKKTVSTLDELSSKIDGGATEEDVDAEDHVVAEYDVYFTAPRSDIERYVMQYPLRPSWRPYELEKRCTEVRLRPSSSEMEVDLTVDVDSIHYDRDSPFADKKQKKVVQTLSSKGKAPETATHAVGLLKGKKLYLSPIEAVVQLRPSMEYANKAVKGEKKQPWICLNYHGPASDLAQTYLKEMTTEGSNLLEFTMNPSDYLNSLCSGAVINKAESDTLLRRSLSPLLVEQQLKKLLAEGPHIQRFNDIRRAAPYVPAQDVLKIVQQHASLVQGVWVSKSNVRCTTGYEKMARDYILFKFSQDPFMKDSELDFLQDKKSILKTVIPNIAVKKAAKEEKDQGWVFGERTDAVFIKCYPDIVKRQSNTWQQHGEFLQEKLDQWKSGKSLLPSLSSIEDARKTFMSKEAREALSKVLGKLFLTHKVCSIQKIFQGLRDTAVSMSYIQKVNAKSSAVMAAVENVHAHREDLHDIISEHAIDVHGLYVLKPSSESEHPELNPLRNVIIHLFRGKEPGAALSEGEITKAFINEPAIKEFQEVICVFRSKVINEYCVFKDEAWVLKNGDTILSSDWESIFKAANLL